jgi:hypothetical protein
MKKEKHTVKTSKRSFYRTQVKIIILTAGPYDPVSLDQVAYDAMYGECSTVFMVEKSEKIDSPTMARLCQEQFSDPALFCLTDQGEDLNDAEEEEEKKQDEVEQTLLPEYRIVNIPEPETKAT